MAVKTDKFGVHEVAQVTFFDLITLDPVLYFDTLKASNLETTAEVTTARGGQGNAKLISWDFNRETTLKMTDALLDPKAIAKMLGTTSVTGVAVIFKRETLTAIVDSTNSAVNLLETPKEAFGAIKVFMPDGTKVVATSLTAKKLVFTTASVPVGTQIVVYYTFDSLATATTFTIDSDKFGGYFKVVGDTVLRNSKNGLDELFQFVIDKAKLNSNFSLTLEAEGDPTAIEFQLDVQKPANSTQMVKFIKQ